MNTPQQAHNIVTTSMANTFQVLVSAWNSSLHEKFLSIFTQFFWYGSYTNNEEYLLMQLSL
jgi:hypothetical protein